MSRGIDARRGDLAVLVTVHRAHYLDGRGVQEWETFEVCEVTNVTRTRLARKVRLATGGALVDIEALKRAGTYRRLYVLPAVEVDVAAALKFAAGRPRPYFDSLAEVKAALRPFPVRPEVMT